MVNNVTDINETAYIPFKRHSLEDFVDNPLTGSEISDSDRMV